MEIDIGEKKMLGNISNIGNVDNIKNKFRKFRINFRIKLKDVTIFFMISKTQTLEGITSLINKEENLHIIFWDLENTTLFNAEQTLKFVQEKYNLSDIYIMSDIESSYRALCFSQVDFKSLLKILLDTYYLDYNFFYWTVLRSKATIRTSNKIGREPNKIISVLQSYEVKMPEKILMGIYDTGNDKIGKMVNIGKR